MVKKEPGFGRTLSLESISLSCRDDCVDPRQRSRGLRLTPEITDVLVTGLVSRGPVLGAFDSKGVLAPSVLPGQEASKWAWAKCATRISPAP